MIICILCYVVVLRLLDLRSSRKLIMSNYLKRSDLGSVSENQASRNTFWYKYHHDIQLKIDEAGWSIKPINFTFRRIFLAIVFPILVMILYFFTRMTMYLFFVLPLGYIAFQMPNRSLNNAINAKKQNFRKELPEYLSSFAIMLQTFTPYEATKRSIDYAGPLLRPYVERLITEIDLNPASTKPYLDFAKNIDIPEAKEFMVALNQATTVSAAQAHKIISDQLKLSDELQEEGYNELIKNRPNEVLKWERSLVFCMIAIILVFTFLQMFKAFSGI